MRTSRVHINDPHDVCCLRPSEFGNDWSHKDNTLAKFKVDTRKEAVEKFAEKIENDKEFQAKLLKLKGLRLSCVCRANQSCHVDKIVDFLERDGRLEEIFGE